MKRKHPLSAAFVCYCRYILHRAITNDNLYKAGDAALMGPLL